MTKFQFFFIVQIQYWVMSVLVCFDLGTIHELVG